MLASHFNLYHSNYATSEATTALRTTSQPLTLLILNTSISHSLGQAHHRIAANKLSGCLPQNRPEPIHPSSFRTSITTRAKNSTLAPPRPIAHTAPQRLRRPHASSPPMSDAFALAAWNWWDLQSTCRVGASLRATACSRALWGSNGRRKRWERGSWCHCGEDARDRRVVNTSAVVIYARVVSACAWWLRTTCLIKAVRQDEEFLEVKWRGCAFMSCS